MSQSLVISQALALRQRPLKGAAVRVQFASGRYLRVTLESAVEGGLVAINHLSQPVIIPFNQIETVEFI